MPVVSLPVLYVYSCHLLIWRVERHYLNLCFAFFFTFKSKGSAWFSSCPVDNQLFLWFHKTKRKSAAWYINMVSSSGAECSKSPHVLVGTSPACYLECSMCLNTNKLNHTALLYIIHTCNSVNIFYWNWHYWKGWNKINICRCIFFLFSLINTFCSLGMTSHSGYKRDPGTHQTVRL